MAVAKPRVIVHPKSFRGLPADLECLFTETLAAPKDGAIHHMVHVQSGVVRQGTARYLIQSQQTCAKPAISGDFQCKTRHRRPRSKTLSHCKNTASASRCGARKTTPWCAARANTPMISTCRDRPMPGSCV